MPILPGTSSHHRYRRSSTATSVRIVNPATEIIVSWLRFFDPVILEGRKQLVTLRDAALCITKLPKAEHDADEWQAAMQVLLLVAEHDGPAMFARIERKAG